jgi:hypothetical protein
MIVMDNFCAINALKITTIICTLATRTNYVTSPLRSLLPKTISCSTPNKILQS